MNLKKRLEELYSIWHPGSAKQPLNTNNEDSIWQNSISKDYISISIHQLSAISTIQDLKKGGSLASALEATKELVTKADLLTLKSDSIGRIYLPSPNAITERIVHDYEETSMSFEAIVTKGVGNSLLGNTPLSGAIEFAEKMMNRSAMFIDPKLVNVYKKTNPRQFNLSFVIMPRDKDEAAMYVSTINLLKDISKAQEKRIFGVLPVLEQDTVVSFKFESSEFEQTYMNLLLNTDIDKTSGFYISSVKSNIQSRGKSTMYSDGMPKTITLDLTLLERKTYIF